MKHTAQRWGQSVLQCASYRACIVCFLCVFFCNRACQGNPRHRAQPDSAKHSLGTLGCCICEFGAAQATDKRTACFIIPCHVHCHLGPWGCTSNRRRSHDLMLGGSLMPRNLFILVWKEIVQASNAVSVGLALSCSRVSRRPCPTDFHLGAILTSPHKTNNETCQF